MKKLILPIAILSLLLTACGGGPNGGDGQNSAGGVTEGFPPPTTHLPSSDTPW